MDINTITSTCFEVIFYLFLLQVLAKNLLGIDIVGALQDLWHKFIIKKMLKMQTKMISKLRFVLLI